MLRRTTITTPIGELTLVASDAGLRAVLWPGERPQRLALAEDVIDLSEDEAADDPVLGPARAQLHEWFEGRRQDFDLPLDPQGTAFQRDVWQVLRSIPYGEVISYGEQARRLGRPSAVRAVGAANGRNPLSIVVPCHRVVGANGALTGFAAGTDVKAWLLDHERAVRAGAPR